MVEAFEGRGAFSFFPSLTVLLTTLAIGLGLELFVLRLMRRVSERVGWQGGAVLVSVLNGRFILWSLLLGVYLALLSTPIELSSQVLLLARQGLFAIFVLSLTNTIARYSARYIDYTRVARERPALSIVVNVVRITVYAIGVLLALWIFDVSITPALAALGVGGLAVSLALQPTLSNLFSGIQLIVSRQLQPGQYVKLGSGDEGFITDINWRVTKIRQLANNVVVVPNSIVTSGILTNYNEPEAELAVLIEVGVSYDSDLEHVERVTREVGRDVMAEIAGGVSSFEPLIRFNRFDDFRINFTVILRGQTFGDQFLIKHEFIKQLHERYRQEGIRIPEPVRTIYAGTNSDGQKTPFAQHRDVQSFRD